MENLQEILQKFAKLSVLWGYDWQGHNHTRYEDRMHRNNQVYGCTYPVSDVIFRNIARAAAGQPLIVSDSIIGTSGNKWEGVNVREEPCSFESAGGSEIHKNDFIHVSFLLSVRVRRDERCMYDDLTFTISL